MERKFVYKFRGDWLENRGISLEILQGRINNSLKDPRCSINFFQVFELVPFPLEQKEVTETVTRNEVVFLNKENA